MQTSYRRLATTTTPSRSASLAHSPSPVTSRLPRSSSSTSIASAHSAYPSPPTTAQTPTTATAATARPGRTMSTVSITAASRSPSVLPGMSNYPHVYPHYAISRHFCLALCSLSALARRLYLARVPLCPI